MRKRVPTFDSIPYIHQSWIVSIVWTFSQDSEQHLVTHQIDLQNDFIGRRRLRDFFFISFVRIDSIAPHQLMKLRSWEEKRHNRRESRVESEIAKTIFFFSTLRVYEFRRVSSMFPSGSSIDLLLHFRLLWIPNEPRLVIILINE